MSQNRRTIGYSINGNNGNRTINDYYLRMYGISFSDIRATATQIQTARKKLKKEYVSPLEIGTRGTVTRVATERMQETLDKIPVEFLSYRVVERKGEMFVVYRLSPEGEGLIGRFLDLHADSEDRLLVGKMRDHGNNFNKASRRGFHPGYSSAL